MELAEKVAELQRMGERARARIVPEPPSPDPWWFRIDPSCGVCDNDGWDLVGEWDERCQFCGNTRPQLLLA